MPIIKSAKKRVRVAARQSADNARTKKSMRTAIKAFQSSLSSGKKIEESQREAQSAIDTAFKKNVISRNRAARLNSRINSQAKEANGGKRKPVKKAPVKKTPTKKTTSKKSTPKTTKKSTKK